VAGEDSPYFCYFLSHNAGFYFPVVGTDREVQVCEYDSSGDVPGSVSWINGIHAVDSSAKRQRDSRYYDNFRLDLYDNERASI
jgi:hypothetical protein